MSRYVMHFYTRCTDPAREEEYNSWYSHIHLPQLRQTKGLISARRYVCMDTECKAKYLAAYEFETDDIRASLRSFFQIVRQCFEAGRHIDCIESIAAVNTPLVACYRELLSEHIPILPRRSYPRMVPEALGELEGHIAS